MQCSPYTHTQETIVYVKKTISLEVRSFILWQPKQDIIEYFTVHSSNCNTVLEKKTFHIGAKVYNALSPSITPALEAIQTYKGGTEEM